MILHDRGEYNLAFGWMLKCAEQGYDEAQCTVAEYYFFGEGAEENTAMALEWWRKAAQQGNKSAIDALSKVLKEEDSSSKNGDDIN